MDEEDVQAAQTQRQNLGRLQRGMRTLEEAYYVPFFTGSDRDGRFRQSGQSFRPDR